jgi:hypothetical protein
MDHLDVHHDERLFTAARKFISGIHGVAFGLPNDHQKAMLSTWRQPPWAKHKAYDKTMGKLVLLLINSASTSGILVLETWVLPNMGITL